MAREFPDRPVVGVGGVVVQDGRALIVKRAHEPRKGEWSLPGGMVELGESLAEATKREIKEETGLDVEVRQVIEVFDRVHRRDGRIQYHFVIVDYLCHPVGGTLRAGDDAEDVAWVTADEVQRYGVNEFATRVIRRGLAMAAEGTDGLAAEGTDGLATEGTDGLATEGTDGLATETQRDWPQKHRRHGVHRVEIGHTRLAPKFVEADALHLRHRDPPVSVTSVFQWLVVFR